MAIKYQLKRAAKIADAPILTRDDFAAAIAALDTNMVELAKETSIHRQYLSEFKNGSRNLQPAVLRQLREHFEAQGIEFDSGNATAFVAGENDSAADDELPDSTLTTDDGAFVIPESFIDEDLNQRQRDNIVKRIGANETSADVTLKKKVDYQFMSEVFGEPQPTDEAEAMLGKVLGRYAENYLLLRALHGTPQVQPLTPQLAEKGVYMPTVADLLNQRMAELLKLTKPRGRTTTSGDADSVGGDIQDSPTQQATTTD